MNRSEADARATALDALGASDPDYRAVRVAEGWVFGWNPASGPVPEGAPYFLVRDDEEGVVHEFTWREEVEDVLQRTRPR